MGRKSLQAHAGRIEELRRRFEAWRRSRPKGRTPEPLWEAAGELAREAGVNPVARELGLDYYNLKRRSEEARPLKRTPKRAKGSSSGFVEVKLPQTPPPVDCVVEIEDGAGTRLTVRLAKGDADAIAKVAKALWSRNS